jgi:hypothetical protein
VAATVRNLLTIGALVTWLGGAEAADPAQPDTPPQAEAAGLAAM